MLVYTPRSSFGKAGQLCGSHNDGYSRGSRGYKLWDLGQDKVVITRDVKFDEDGTASLKDSQTECVKIDSQNDEHEISYTLDQVQEYRS